MSKPASQAESSGRTLVFRVSQEQFGLPLASVVEVFESANPPIPVPGAPDWVAGVINHHGQVVPVLRMRKFLMAGYAQESAGSRSRTFQIILVDLAEGRFGLEVDQIESIEDLRTDGADFHGKKRTWHRGALLEMIEPDNLTVEIGRRLGQDPKPGKQPG